MHSLHRLVQRAPILQVILSNNACCISAVLKVKVDGTKIYYASTPAVQKQFFPFKKQATILGRYFRRHVIILFSH